MQHRYSPNLMRHSTAIGTSGVTLLALLIGGMFFWQGRMVYHAKNMVAHTYQVTDQIQLLSARLEDAAHQKGRGAMPTDLMDAIGDLRRLTSDNPRQQENLDRMGGLVHALLRCHDGCETAMTPIRSLLSAMADEESRLLGLRTHIDQENVWRNNWLMGGGLIVFYLLMLVSVGLATRRGQQLQLAHDELEKLYAKTREQNLAHKELLAAIVECSEDAIISKDRNGYILTWNHGAERLFGYRAAEAIGQHINLIIPPERLEEEKNIIINLHEGKPLEHFETVRMAKGGRTVDISLSVSPLRDEAGRIIGASKVARDISERKQAEQRMAHLVDELSASNTQLERFAYICSHDLQEPLRMISNYTQRLAQHLGDRLDDKGRHYMKYITDGADNARALISDVLAYARIGNETQLPEPVDIAAVYKNVLVNLETAIQECGAEVTCDALPTVLAFPTQVFQLLQNLLTNALKFHGSEKPRVHIGARRQNGWWEISVRDNGIGIPQKYQDKIFAIFVRLNKRSDYPGTGIGLAICKKIVERAGGQIRFESTVGGGTTFFFTMPAIFPAEESKCAS